MRNNKNRETKINTCITVSADECRGDAEKMVRKFSKKVKKDGIIDEYRDRTHFKKNSIKRTEKKRAKKRLIEKVNSYLILEAVDFARGETNHVNWRKLTRSNKLF